MIELKNRYKILTPNGYENFSSIRKIKSNTLIKFYFNDNTYIRVTPEHRFMLEFNLEEFAENIQVNQVLNNKVVTKIEYEKGDFEVYDATNVDNEVYYTNNIPSHNCFHGSSYTLLKSEIIQNFKKFILSETWFPPKEQPIENTIYKYKQWFTPEKGKSYLIGADIADGIGNDSSIILVFDITNGKHIKQVASFGENTVSTVEFAYILVKIASLYNNAHIAVEANGIGRSVLDSLETIYSYENVINYGGTRESGILSHVQTKANACMWARNITSIVQIDIYEKLLVAEMEYFEKKLGKFNIYQAVATKHDDYMMSFIWGLFCLQEEIIDNYYNVERFETTSINITIPTIIKNFNGEYFNYNEPKQTNVNSDIDNIYKNLVNGNKSNLDQLQNNSKNANPDEDEGEDYDVVYDENNMDTSPSFGNNWI